MVSMFLIYRHKTPKHGYAVVITMSTRMGSRASPIFRTHTNSFRACRVREGTGEGLWKVI